MNTSTPSDPTAKKRYLLLPGELGDGANSFAHRIENPFSAAVLGDMLRTFQEEGCVGDTITITLKDTPLWDDLPED